MRTRMRMIPRLQCTNLVLGDGATDRGSMDFGFRILGIELRVDRGAASTLHRWRGGKIGLIGRIRPMVVVGRTVPGNVFFSLKTNPKKARKTCVFRKFDMKTNPFLPEGVRAGRATIRPAFSRMRNEGKSNRIRLNPVIFNLSGGQFVADAVDGQQ